jgi:hypothetical protein
MSIFSKSISQIDSHDLFELLTEQSVENVRLEFKREVPNKDDTLKKLSSFANTFGGFIVIGAEANSADGRIVGLPGIEAKPSYKQTLVQWCFEGVTPPLDLEVSDPIPTPAGDGKVCYVMYTAESDLTPHFLNGRKGVYVRTNEFSGRFEPKLATENELRHLLDRRRLVQQRRSELVSRARNRFHTFAERRYRELNKTEKEIGCTFDLSVVPRFPVRQLRDHPGIESMLKMNRLRWRGGRFPRDMTTFISQHESAIALRPASSFSILEANVWGLLFYATEIERHREYSGIHLYNFLGLLLVFIKHACQMLREFSYVGPLHIEMNLESMRGIPWIYSQHDVPTQGPASELDNEVTFSIVSTSETLAQKPDRIAMDLLRYVFFAMNWLDIADTDEELAELVKAGYKYNSWTVPAELQA